MQPARDKIMPIRVCHVIPSINEFTGGTALAVTKLAESLANQGVESHIFTLNYPHRGSQLIPKGVSLHSQSTNHLNRSLRGWSPQASSKLINLAKDHFDIIHNHGMWMFPNVYARQAAVRNNLPLVTSTHGMAENWSLNRSRIQKQIAWQWYEKKNLESASLFHATSEMEKISIQQLNFKQPIAQIPIGVDLPNFSQDYGRNLLIELFPELSEKKWLLFLARLHPKKGLENLLQVWHELAYFFPDWHLIIAGSDWNGYRNQLIKLVEELDLNKQVTFTGMLVGETKESALANADLFVLPTYSENFGIAVAESLARQVPVITTKEAPWEDLTRYECGWWIDNTQQALKEALQTAMMLSPEQRKLMGKRGQQLITQKYTWNAVSEQMATVYRWLLSGEEPPNYVYFS